MSRLEGLRFRLKVQRFVNEQKRWDWWYVAKPYQDGGERFSQRKEDALVVDYETMQNWRISRQQRGSHVGVDVVGV